ncbi:MAG: tRNA (adenosine(37)-N6)-threonylcarbamoyltransferase complex dimerization subunit type 1 TsaB, partial [Mycobacteriales bacterium]
MRVLVLDTSTPAVSAGLVDTTTREVLAERVVVDGRRHGELLAVGLREVLLAADPDEVVVGVGPGPFTGLRVGIMTAAAFASARGLPVRGVCSLDGLAAPSTVVVTDARRKEVYWAVYDGTGARVDGPHVSAPSEVPTAGLRVVGDGARLYGLATEDQPLYPSV